MSYNILHPICVSPDALVESVVQQGMATLNVRAICELAGVTENELMRLASYWDTLVDDKYLKDGGRYRKRRHSCYVLDNKLVFLEPHRSHWQSIEYNALHGGLKRCFEPILPEVKELSVWASLLSMLGAMADEIRGPRKWFAEVHQFRIDTVDGIGRPTPEGAHRDGVDLVAVFFVKRHNVKGGETRVFDVNRTTGQRFTLTKPWTMILLDDYKVIHESTPIQPLDGGYGYRDTLVVTLRSGAFQGDNVP